MKRVVDVLVAIVVGGALLGLLGMWANLACGSNAGEPWQGCYENMTCSDGSVCFFGADSKGRKQNICIPLEGTRIKGLPGGVGGAAPGLGGHGDPS